MLLVPGGCPQRRGRSLRTRARSRCWAARTSGWRAFALRQCRCACSSRVSTTWLGWVGVGPHEGARGPKFASMELVRWSCLHPPRVQVRGLARCQPGLKAAQRRVPRLRGRSTELAEDGCAPRGRPPCLDRAAAGGGHPSPSLPVVTSEPSQASMELPEFERPARDPCQKESAHTTGRVVRHEDPRRSRRRRSCVRRLGS